MNNILEGDTGAIPSVYGPYRYALWRRWDEGKPTVLFIMLNPSTADAERDDPTIRRCIGFAKSWGCGGVLVGNLFAWRATKPRDLKADGAAGKDIVGAGNDEALEYMAKRSKLVVAAWGNHGTFQCRGDEVRQRFGGQLHCLRLNKTCEPAHPLTLPKHLKPHPLSEHGPKH